jgi:hypothetical protein
MNRAGRNEPCPCGSGKKYKHCCKTGETRARLTRFAILVLGLAAITAIVGLSTENFWIGGGVFLGGFVFLYIMYPPMKHTRFGLRHVNDATRHGYGGSYDLIDRD